MAHANAHEGTWLQVKAAQEDPFSEEAFVKRASSKSMDKSTKLSIALKSSELVVIEPSGTTSETSLEFVNIRVCVQPQALGHMVGITYTWDDWKTVAECDTTHSKWVENINEEEIWEIRIPNPNLRDRMLFAVFVENTYTKQREWDHNFGWNHEFNKAPYLSRQIKSLKKENAELKDRMVRETNSLRTQCSLLQGENISHLPVSELESLLKRTRSAAARIETEILRKKVNEEKLCVVCCENERNLVLFPCGHVTVCSFCFGSNNIATCPVCRQKISSSHRIFL